MNRQRRVQVLEHLDACSSELLTAVGCKEARCFFERRPPPDVVVTDLSLNDGSWWMIRQEILQAQLPTSLVVCIPAVDGGVTDILEGGADDVLIPPYERQKVERIVGGAVVRRRMRSSRATM